MFENLMGLVLILGFGVGIILGEIMLFDLRIVFLVFESVELMCFVFG